MGRNLLAASEYSHHQLGLQAWLGGGGGNLQSSSKAIWKVSSPVPSHA